MHRDAPAYPTTDGKCAHEDCDRLAWLSCPEGFCLFHSPYNGRLDAAARTVWETARRMAQAGDCDFGHWHFPPDPDLDLDRSQGGFFGATFSRDAWFDGATFSGDAWFGGATFSGETYFMGATFRGHASFENVTFSGDAEFEDATFSEGAGFLGATFSRKAWFRGATFSGNAEFRRATFSGDALFWCATFERTADFDRTQFNADALFESVRFAADAGFNSSRFAPGCNIVFDSPHWRRRPFRLRRGGESAYRFAKQAAQERGDYTEAGRYHYAEQCAIEDRHRHESRHRPWRRPFWFWLVRLLFGRIVFGYGERPSHPLLLGLAVIVACALVFCCIDGVVPDPKSAQTSLAWWQYGYFSVVTFTTLGYGDYQPRQGWPQVLAGIEAALGAALLATFVVCLTRKYMR